MGHRFNMDTGNIEIHALMTLEACTGEDWAKRAWRELQLHRAVNRAFTALQARLDSHLVTTCPEPIEQIVQRHKDAQKSLKDFLAANPHEPPNN